MTEPDTLDRVVAPTERLLARFIDLAPQILLVVLVVAGGGLAAVLSGRLVTWLVRRLGLETLSEKIGLPKALYALGYHDGVAKLLGRFAFWVAILLTVLTAAEIAGFNGVADALSGLVAFVPQIVIGVVIVAGGVWVGNVARAMVLRVARRGDAIDSPRLIGEVVFYSIVVVSLTLAAEQLGIETGLINILVAIAFGTFGLGLAGAFALSARTTLANVIAQYYASRLFNPGDHVEFDDTVGVVVRFTATSVVLRTEERGELTVPCEALVAKVVRRQSAL